MNVSGSLREFNRRLDELCGSKYLLADAKVGEVLKAIASDEMLYAIFAHITAGFNYAAVKSASFKYISGKGEFVPPEKDDDFMALAFFLLMEIDDKKEDLFALCNKYFYSAEGNQTAYDNFCRELVVPFGEIVNKTAYRLINADFNEPAREKPTPIITNGIILAVKEEKGKLNGVLAAVKSEAEFVLDKLVAFLEAGDMESAAVAYIAIKCMNRAENLGLNVEKLLAEMRKIGV